MFSQELQDLVKATLVDGVLTGKERDALVKRAKQEGADLDELEIYINSLLQKKDQEEAKASLAGSVKRCPNCGGIVEPGWAACPHCGVSFDNDTSANDVVEELRKKLTNLTESRPHSDEGYLEHRYVLEMVQQKMSVIKSTPVPNNRKDLLELLAHVKSLADKTGPKNGIIYNNGGDKIEDLSFAYWHLFSICIDMARASYSADPAFIYFFSEYEKMDAKERTFKNKWQEMDPRDIFSSIFLSIFFLIGLVCLIVVC